MTHSPEQLAVIERPSRNLIVLAGAGSGKTRCMAARIQHMIANGQNPRDIIAFTFTVKAGRELAERIGQPLYHSGSIHALCLKEAQKWGVWNGRPNIIDDAEAAREITTIATSMRLHKKATTKAVCMALASGHDLDSFGPPGLVAKAFRRWCLSRNSTTMDLLLHEATKRLVPNLTTTRIIWDEWQDSGDADKVLLQQFRAAGMDITIVADPNQSIYSFRGSRPEHLMELVWSSGWDVLRLCDNYRSGCHIVDHANMLIRDGAWMNCKKPNVGATPIVRHKFDNETSELGMLRGRITELPKGQTLAILCRHNALAARLEAALLDVLPPQVTPKYSTDGLKSALGYCNLMAEECKENAPFASAVTMQYVNEFWSGSWISTSAALLEAIEANDQDVGSLSKYGNITIGTVHSVKGLEFDEVIVVGCEAALWPGRKTGKDLEEERRIMYVAATRAENRLIFTSCAIRRNLYSSEMVTSTPSPLLYKP